MEKIKYQINRSSTRLSPCTPERFHVEDFSTENDCINHVEFRANQYAKLGYKVNITRYNGNDWEYHKTIR